jgi:ABC-2 type transport system ATP-binding protein
MTIEARALEKRYGDRLVVDAVSLKVGSGEIFALLGGNGAGKTTTLHMLLGLVAADAGKALIGGEEVRPSRRAKAAFVPEVVDLYPDLDPLETLELFAGVAGIDAPLEARVRALESCGLDAAHHRRRVRILSKGMRQKVALAAAEVQGATSILLDEPTSGLDPSAADQLMTRLAILKSRGAAILMSTHDVLQVESVADRIGIMKSGRLVVERSRSDLDGKRLMDLYREVNAG